MPAGQLRRKSLNCAACKARVGERHQLGCDVERCPRCGFQFIMCVECGCPESMPDETWPPPMNERLIWTGDWPGIAECHSFDLFREVRTSNGPVLTEDLNRLLEETEWDRWRKRFVRTSLSQAFVEMKRKHIVWSRGWQLSRREAIAEVTDKAMRTLEEAERVDGYAFYTWEGHRRKRRGRDFAIYFGQVQHPIVGPIGRSDAEVGKIVCECLKNHGVDYLWEGDPSRPIRVIAKSIAVLDAS
jgi:hypothetical protein